MIVCLCLCTYFNACMYMCASVCERAHTCAYIFVARVLSFKCISCFPTPGPGVLEAVWEPCPALAASPLSFQALAQWEKPLVPGFSDSPGWQGGVQEGCTSSSLAACSGPRLPFHLRLPLLCLALPPSSPSPCSLTPSWSLSLPFFLSLSLSCTIFLSRSPPPPSWPPERADSCSSGRREDRAGS